MKVQDVEMNCLAKTGISVEFSNSEIDSITRLVLRLDKAIEDKCREAHAFVEASETGETYEETDKIPVEIRLKEAIRISWLLDAITMHRARKPGDLFDQADANYLAAINDINRAEGE